MMQDLIYFLVLQSVWQYQCLRALWAGECLWTMLLVFGDLENFSRPGFGGRTDSSWVDSCSKDRQGCWLLCGPRPETFEKKASLIMACSASHKRNLRQITHIFTKCKLPSISLPYFTEVTCGLEFVFIFAHDYLLSLWMFPERPCSEAALGPHGYTDTYEGMHKHTLQSTTTGV